jgi:hypothetical protein
MISIKYQLLFFDPSQNRENQLSAIQPFFNSPSAVKVLLKTARFEGKDALVYSGQEDLLEEMLKNIARLDTTDWLDFDFDKLAQAIDDLAKELGIAKFEIKQNDDDEQQVLGDPPDEEESVMKIEALTKSSAYPSDIPDKNYWLWDDIKKNYRSEIRKRAGRDPDKKEAVQRILYANSALKLNLLPFSFSKTTEVNDARDVLCHDIEEGEERASDLIETWERHLKSDGTLKRTKAIKYLGSEFEETSSRYYIAHAVEWTLGTDWKSLSDYLKKNHGFHVLSKDHLSMALNKLTKLEVIQDEGDTVSIYVSHVFTPSQAATLTAKSEKEAIVKMLHKYSNLWYKNGKFPDVKKV